MFQYFFYYLFTLYNCAIFISFDSTIRVSNSLDQDQAQNFVWPDLDPNCLQRLSADDKSIHVITWWWPWGRSGSQWGRFLKLQKGVLKRLIEAFNPLHSGGLSITQWYKYGIVHFVLLVLLTGKIYLKWCIFFILNKQCRHWWNASVWVFTVCQSTCLLLLNN